MNIAVIIPTIREENCKIFLGAWAELFEKHKCKVIVVQDGDEPVVIDLSSNETHPCSLLYVMGTDHDLIYNKSDVVRNMGFFYAKATYDPDVYITLDDDTLPVGDPIQDHLDTLTKRFPSNWMSTASEYMRGVPYGVRKEMECMVSHGIWYGVADWDAPTQLINGNKEVTFYKGGIPKGVFFPLCGMNIAFKKEVLPYIYYAPMGHKVSPLDRFGDIWLGINLKKTCDEKNWAIATGYAAVQHDRASNVWKNMQKEAKGLELNEEYFKGVEDDPYFTIYNEKREKWEKLIKNYDTNLSGKL